MRKITILLFLLVASGFAVSAERCPASERELIGAWTRSGDAGVFEEFVLEADADVRTFNSWLHQRPHVAGATWRLEECRLVVTLQHAEFETFRLRVLALRRGKLRLYDESDGRGSVYVRLPDEP